MMKKMALYSGAGKSFNIVEKPVTPPEAGQVGLELISSGICGTDVHIHGGYMGMPDMPLILGHEFIGKVHAIGSQGAKDALGNELAVGDAAIACVAIPCGKCFNCLRGETASCLAFGVTYVKDATVAPYFYGGFAEYLYSPEKNLVKLPANVDPFAAAAFPCGGPTVIRSCAYGGGLEEGELVVIQGNGSLGLFALAWAKAHACRTVVIGSATNPERMKLTEAFAPDLFLDYRKNSLDDMVARIKELATSLNRGDGADVVIETSGSIDAVPTGLKLLRTRGRYFVPGQYSNRGPIAIEPQEITFRALQIFGSGQYTMQDLAVYVNFLADHPELQEIFAKLVTKFPVSEADEAMKAAHEGKTIKAVFAMV